MNLNEDQCAKKASEYYTGGVIGGLAGMGQIRSQADGAACGSAVNTCSESPKDDGRVGPHALQLAAQAWCEPGTSHKVMDAGLAYAFARILERELRKPWLGNATTGELLGEIAARCDMGYRTTGR